MPTWPLQLCHFNLASLGRDSAVREENRALRRRVSSSGFMERRPRPSRPCLVGTFLCTCPPKEESTNFYRSCHLRSKTQATAMLRRDVHKISPLVLAIVHEHNHNALDIEPHQEGRYYGILLLPSSTMVYRKHIQPVNCLRISSRKAISQFHHFLNDL